ncbi:hypothetical protein [Oceanidesulfovibrio indonesiensis]|nr:hypothetical protein [Oceanidesulfovibrio indonesiensis]
MKVDVYQVKLRMPTGQGVSLLVPAGTDLNTLPAKVRDLGELHFDKTIDLETSDTRIALDSEKAIANIGKDGYHLQGWKMDVQNK